MRRIHGSVAFLFEHHATVKRVPKASTESCIIPPTSIETQLVSPNHLLLRRSTLFRLDFRPLLPNTHQPRIAPCNSQLPVRGLLSRRYIALLDLAEAIGPNVGQHLANRLDAVGCFPRGSNFLLGSVTFLVSAGAAWEDDDALHVRFQAGYVGG